MTSCYSTAQKSSLLNIRVYAHYKHGEDECVARLSVTVESLLSGVNAMPDGCMSRT
jgi:hypothetical protein